MIIINNKEIRNTVEQVHKNKDDIKDLQETEVTKDYVDNSISAIYGDFYTRDQADDRFPTETHMNLLLGYKQDKLTAGNNITIDANNVISATGGSTPTNYVTTDSTQYITASKIFKTAVGASTGATIYPASGSFYTEKDGTSTSFAPQKISLSISQSATPFNFQIHSSQGEGHNGTYTFDNSKTGIVAVTSDIPDAVSGTNDGTNWTSLTIGNVTKNIPQGGGGGGSQLYAHSVSITYSNASTKDRVGGVAYFISNDNTAITKDNIITKLVAAGYGDSKKIIFSGHAYAAGQSQSCSLTSLAKKSNSSTNLKAYVYYAGSGSTTSGSITIDTSDTTVELDITDTVVAL